ncbi:MAG: aldehyde ferredoxin oxidoreductase family protein [Deltaproteobacteria bacterium]|nr:aldehyde ferredoxin oxidoreductase family protein [Deltaproteobacteria bacterium]
MGTPGPVNDRILDVDLTTGHIDHMDVSPEDRRRFLGGKGIALKILHDAIRPGTDPMSPDNILVMMTGPTAGTPSPAGGRFIVAGKSPLTGIFGSSLAGGRVGLSLKRAGFDGIVIRGCSDSPVYIKVTDDGAVIEDASSLWGMDTYQVQEERKHEGDWAVIGPAGEHLVRYAVIVSGRRVSGRCGLGTVMGSKNLKGIVARGGRKFRPADPGLFEKAVKRAQEKVASHPNTGTQLRELGTPQNVMLYGTSGITPVRNFSVSNFDKIQHLSAEKIKNEHYVKNHGCVGCPIQCGRMGRYGGRELVSPEYETIGLMGSNLMIDDLSMVAEWNDILNRLGMDSISAGGTIGFAMELMERGMLSGTLSFGSASGISELLQDIAYRRGLGDELAEGVKRLSEKYSGEDFAIHVKGLEMAAYDPRGCTGQGLAYATANCGATHLSGSTHAIEVNTYLSQHGTKGKPHFVKFMQDLTDAVNSSIFCIQTMYPFLEENFAYKYTPLPIMQFIMRNLPAIAVKTTDLSDYAALMSGLLGYRISKSEYYEIGERIFNLERLMNCREGINRADDTLPPRLLNEVREDGWPSIELESMLDSYYHLRGWDPTGHPTQAVLDRLGISQQEGF